METIEYYYAAHSAYAYLGSAHFMKIARSHDWRIVHRPMDLHRVMEACGSVAFRERSAAYRGHFFSREIERWGEYRGVRLLGHRPTHHHHSYDLANRLLIAAQGQGRNVDLLAHRLLEAHWADDADLADAETLSMLAQGEGFDGAELIAAAASPAVAAQYATNTAEAIERSVFGSPTYVVDGDMFYGQDRLALVERALTTPFRKSWP